MDNQIQSLKNKTNSKQDGKSFPAFLISALAHIDDNYTANTPGLQNDINHINLLNYDV